MTWFTFDNLSHDLLNWIFDKVFAKILLIRSCVTSKFKTKYCHEQLYVFMQYLIVILRNIYSQSAH